ncbi:MAG: hypothetical protein H0S85_03790 [Desulfovibrionaceae bacterium]|jgi:hypothetical protein|nr:hypothetical protein [Desulfovibrionaceae bacterium]
MQQRQVIVVKSPKSVGISLILTFLLGPLGMFYSTILGGLIMSALTVVLGVLTLGISWWLTWPVCMLWGALAVGAYNRRLAAEATAQVYMDR